MWVIKDKESENWRLVYDPDAKEETPEEYIIRKGKAIMDKIMTKEDFERILCNKLVHMRANALLHIPGIIEILAEYYRNEIIGLWKGEQISARDNDSN